MASFEKVFSGSERCKQCFKGPSQTLIQVNTTLGNIDMADVKSVTGIQEQVHGVIIQSDDDTLDILSQWKKLQSSGLLDCSSYCFVIWDMHKKAGLNTLNFLAKDRHFEPKLIHMSSERSLFVQTNVVISQNDYPFI